MNDSREPRGGIFRSIDPLKAQFLAASLMFLVLFAVYAAQTLERFRAVVEDELTYVNRLLVEGMRGTLIAQESRLRMLGEQLLRLDIASDPENGRDLIEEMRRLDDGMVGFGLARADGQLVLVSGLAAESRLPNLMQGEATRESFREAVKGRGLSVGRPYFMEALGEWVIPLRVGLPDKFGEVQWVMTAGMNLAGGNTLLARMELPANMGVGILRDDGYLQYATEVDTPYLQTDSVRNFYGVQIPAAVTALGKKVAERGNLLREIELPRLGGGFLASIMRLPEYGLTSISATSLKVVYRKAAKQLAMPFAFMLTCLLATFGAYRRARHQQQIHDHRLMHLAHHDPLTSLPNRLLVMDRLEQALAISDRQGRSAALLFIDLDNFKTINDTYGHRFGDQLILRMRDIFTAAVRSADTVARLGGDEFLIVLPELEDDSDARLLAERILERFREPVDIMGQQIYTSASIGIAVGPRDSADPQELLRHADIALYDAKGRGKQCYSFFDSRLNEAAQRRTLLERHLRSALQREELSVVYQPIYEAGPNGAMRGVEALVRWKSADLGNVSPAEFIPVAEEAGLVSDIGCFVMRRSMHDLARLNDGGAGLRLSVNVSANEFRSGKLVQTVRDSLCASGLTAGNLMLELTESVMMEDLAGVKAQLLEIRNLGVSVALDDFGTGYSSLSYLNKLPITTLKIDRSFVRDLYEDAEDLSLIRSIIALGRGLDMVIVAEGVESAEHAELLAGMGCDLLQGFYFSRPVEIATIAGMARRRVARIG